MNEADLEIRLRFGQAMAIEAGQQAKERYLRRHELKIESKGVQNFVSEADRECESTITRAIRQAFPNDSVLGEEHGLDGPGTGMGIRWMIDPIDGTINFVRGLPLWCVSIGLLVENEPVAGIIYNPIAGELYSSKRGGGAWLNGKPIRVSAATAPGESRIGIAFSYRRSLEDHVRAVSACFAAHCEFARLGSSALGLAYTADGRLDGFWASHAYAWDVAAGMSLVREAGGWVSDFLAGDGLNGGNTILAAPQSLAEKLRRMLPA
jgi:myo-inositol-1(or 4)-monophosphatase